MLCESRPAGILTRDLSVASPTPCRSTNTQHVYVWVTSLNITLRIATFERGAYTAETAREMTTVDLPSKQAMTAHRASRQEQSVSARHFHVHWWQYWRRRRTMTALVHNAVDWLLSNPYTLSGMHTMRHTH